MAAERRRVFYAGRVQGVGFRYSAQWLAGNYAVAGYVRNLPDGRVELVAEGEPEALDEFLQAVAAEMAHNIQNTQTEVGPPSDPPLQGFTIRR